MMQGIWLEIETVLKLISENPNISDLHLSAGDSVAFRFNGEIVKKEELWKISDENMEIILKQLFNNNPQRFEKFLWDKEADFAYIAKNDVAYRVNAFLKTGRIGIVMRKIDRNPKKLEEIMFQDTADIIRSQILSSNKGLFLITGPTGAWKSTSIVAMLEEINQSSPVHIITVEDPIEYVFEAKKALFSQREILHDTRSFENSIKAALREDPDIIMVGEIRDSKTAEAVLDLAETGHLVFSTLHTNSSVSTLNRFLSFFSAEMQNWIIERLSDCLSGVLSQILVKRKDGNGRVALFELMLNNSAVRNNLKKREIDQLHNILETSSQSGMITMKQYAKKLLERGIIDQSEVQRLINNRSF